MQHELRLLVNRFKSPGQQLLQPLQQLLQPQLEPERELPHALHDEHEPKPERELLHELQPQFELQLKHICIYQSLSFIGRDGRGFSPAATLTLLYEFAHTNGTIKAAGKRRPLFVFEFLIICRNISSKDLQNLRRDEPRP